MTNTITIETPCGSFFETKISELTNNQIRDLIHINPDNPLTPLLQEVLTARRQEVDRGRQQEWDHVIAELAKSACLSPATARAA